MTSNERKLELIQNVQYRINLCKQYIQMYSTSTYNEQRRKRLRELENELESLQKANPSLAI